MALPLWEKVKATFSKVVYFNFLLASSLFYMSMASTDNAEKNDELLDTVVREQNVSNEKGLQATNVVANEKTDETNQTRTEDRGPRWKARVRGLFMSLQWSPNSALVPFMATTLIMVQAYRTTTSLNMSFGDLDKFKQTCPVDGRRTPHETLVKLSATTILTVGVNLYRSSLIGGQSWKREAIRVLETVISPLGTLCNFAVMISYEIASTFRSNPRLWHDEPGYTYRLGRMLNCRMHTTSSHLGQYIRYVNPKHIDLSRQPRAQAIKMYGHMLLISVLMAHYLQLGTLIFRRLASDSFTVLDLAILFLTTSAFVALIQSLLITIVTPHFTLRSDFKSCTEKSCLLDSCKRYKSSVNLASDAHRLMLFGYNCTGVPGQVLGLLMGATVMSVIIYPESRGVWPWWPLDVWSRIYGLYGLWKASIYIAAAMGSMKGLMKDLAGDEKQENRTITEVQPASTSEQQHTAAMETKDANETPERLSSPQPAVASTWKSSLIDTSIQIALFSGGIIIPLVFLFCILFQLLVLSIPVRGLASAITEETVKMTDWNTTTACPQMWKDPLSTKLWGF